MKTVSRPGRAEKTTSKTAGTKAGIPIYARLGMTAQVMTDDGSVSGPIIGMTAEVCTIAIERPAHAHTKYDDGVGAPIARRWCDVELINVLPAPGEASFFDEPQAAGSQEADMIHRAANRDIPKAAGFARQYEEATNLDNEDTPELLFAIIDHFLSHPMAERRRMLSGWSFERWPTMQEGMACYARQAPVPMLWIEADKDGDVAASFRTVPEDCTAPARLLIYPGTSKANALAAIERLAATVETEWETLIYDPAQVTVKGGR